MKKGFTLVEILIVVVIAVSVAAFSVPAYKKAQEKASYNAAAGFLSQLGTAVKNLRADLAMEGSNRLFPVDGKIAQVDINWSNVQNANYTTATNAAKVSDLDTNIKLGSSLVARGYMPAFPFQALPYNGYSFYICPQNAPSTDNCCASDVVVCMQNNLSINYHRGRFLNTGVITSHAR